MIAVPPFEEGALNDTVARALPRTAVAPVGASGTVTGVTEFEALDEAPVPAALVAVTTNVYAVPLLRLVTMIGEVELDEVNAPGFEVTA